MRTGKGNRGALIGLFFFAALACVPASPVATAGETSWATSAHVGFDSNVSLSVHDPQDDAYFGASVVFHREPIHESRFDWSLVASLEGSQYAETDDLSYAAFGLSPGLAYVPHSLWTIRVSPFVEAKAVKDTDQRAISFGIAGSLEERIGSRWYAGQSYGYTVSRAEVETYSYAEHLFGLFLGANWTEHLSGEVGYTYSHGDSFRTVDTDTLGDPLRRGRHRRYSETFGADVVRETVDRHAGTVRFGIGWTQSLFSQLSYEYTVLGGDFGSAEGHHALFEIGLEF